MMFAKYANWLYSTIIILALVAITYLLFQAWGENFLRYYYILVLVGVVAVILSSVWHWLEGQKQEANLILFPIVLPLIYFLFTFLFDNFDFGPEHVFIAGLQGFFTVIFLFLGAYLLKDGFEKRNFTMGLAGVVCVWILTLAGFVFLL